MLGVWGMLLQEIFENRGSEMAFGGIFECLLARVLCTFNFESEIKF